MPLLGSRGAASLTGFGGLAKLGYLLRNSWRFRASNSNYLNRTFGTPTNNKVWTWSAWVKRGSLSLADADHLFFGSPTDVGANPSSYARLVFETDGTLRLQSASSASEGFTSSAVFRDPAAWYHIVLYMDAVNTTVRCYVNGTEIAYASRSNPTNTNTAINGSGNHHRMGFFRNAEPRPMDGYMAEVNFVDGQALTPSSFGKTDSATGQWIPKKFGGAYGTNGFYLPFTNTASTSTLGNDFSGRGNTWTVNNISLTAGVTYDSMTDVPTLTSATVANYATLNPLSMADNLVLNSGNLAVSNSNGSDTHRIVRAGIGMTTGKWYWEVHVNNSANVDIVGLADDTTGNAGNNYIGGTGKSAGWGYSTSTGDWYQGPWTVNSPTPPAFPSSGIIGVAYDADAGRLWFSSNGSWLSANGGTGNPAAGLNPNLTLAGTAGTAFYPAISIYYNGGTWAFNFGQRPFAYSSNLSGFKALNTYNLP